MSYIFIQVFNFISHLFKNTSKDIQTNHFKLKQYAYKKKHSLTWYCERRMKGVGCEGSTKVIGLSRLIPILPP